MASINELKEVLKESLEEKGVLQEVRAKIRSEIFKSLEDKQHKKPRLSEEQLVINEIIREYLIHNGMTHTLAVFLPESGTPDRVQYDRDYLQKRLKIVEDQQSMDMPLIYGLTFGLKKMVGDTQHQHNLLNFQNDLPSRQLTQPARNIPKDIFTHDQPDPLQFQHP